jgi:hypothetical protein
MQLFHYNCDDAVFDQPVSKFEKRVVFEDGEKRNEEKVPLMSCEGARDGGDHSNSLKR